MGLIQTKVNWLLPQYNLWTRT